MKLRHAWWVAVGLLAAAPLLASPVNGQAGPFALTLTVAPDPPAVGNNTITAAITRGGQPVTGASVTATASMLDMAMGSTQSAAAEGTTPGSYSVPANLSMAGRWAVDLNVTAGGQSGRYRLELTTGNPVHQVSQAGSRAVWLWGLLMVLVPLAIALLPKRMVREGARDWRGPVAGTLLLIFAVLFARAVVRTYKRPGQMSVIESQAMDMSAMKPPVGLVPVAVETVKLESFQGGVSYTGSVVPYAQQDVYPRVTGLIVDMPVYPGDRVRAGQLVARLDTRELGSKQTEAVMAHLAAQEAAGAARQDVRGVEGQVEQAQAEYRMATQRIQQMTAERAAAEAMIRRSESELASAQAKVRQAASQVAAAQATQRTRTAMTEESQAMVRQAEADQTGSGGMVAQAGEELTAAQREAAEADQMTAAARAGQERAAAEAASARAGLPQAQADVAAMQADVKFQNVELERMEALVRQGAVSREEYDRQKSDRDQAVARLNRAQAMVEQTQSMIHSAEAMARQSTAEVGAAQERRGRADAMVRAAQAKLAQARAEVASRSAMLSQRQSGVKGRRAEEDEAASMINMRQAEAESMQADVGAAQAAIEQARQEAAKAASGIAEARADRDRAAGMIRERMAMASAARSRAGEATSRAAQARAAAFTAETVAGYTELRATVDGVVTDRITSPATLVQPGMLLMRIAQIDQVRLQANVAQADAAQVRVGAPVEVTPRKEPGRKDTTVVTTIFPASNPSSRTQIVEARIDNHDNAYLPGDFVTMRIGTGAANTTVLSVPTRALVQVTAPGGAVIGENQPAVWVVRPDTAAAAPAATTATGTPAEAKTEYYCTMHPEVVSDKPGKCPKCGMDLVPRTAQAAAGTTTGIAARVPIKVGRTSADRAEVLEGLKPGDQVIVSGFDNLREGDRVNIVSVVDTAAPSASGGAGSTGRDRTPRGPAAGIVAPSGGSPVPVPASPRAELLPPRSASSGARPAAPARPAPAPKPAPAKQLYTCPMHPEVISDKPGKCPKCHMDLVPKQ